MKKTSRSLFGQPSLRPTNYNTTEPFEDVDLSTKSVLVVDNGLFVEWAVMLAKNFGKVYYHVPNMKSFPDLNISTIGYGMENLILCNEMFDWGEDYNFDKIDLFVFPDVNMGGMQEHLIRLGKRVWGSRRGEELESRRFQTKVWMYEHGLDVNEATKIIGIDALTDYLEENKDQYVKISYFRDTFETFHHEDIFITETWLNELTRKVGWFKDYIEFIVEVPIKTDIEYGFDGYTVDGQYPKQGLWGFEVKDKAYISRAGELPEVLKEINDLFTPILIDYGFRGNMSNEVRLSDGVGYMSDFCARLGSPPSELYQEMISNWAEICYHGAMGNMIEPEYVAKYGAEIMMDTMWVDLQPMCISFPPKYRNNVKLCNCCKVDGKYYIIPQKIGLSKVCSVIGMGDTIEEAKEQANNIAKEVKGYSLNCHSESLDEAEKIINEAKELGIKF